MATFDAAGAAATQMAQASKVPQVPDAGRIRPLPKPKAINRPGSRQTQDTDGYAARERSRMEGEDLSLEDMVPGRLREIGLMEVLGVFGLMARKSG